MPISVIIPAHNEEGMIARTLRSMLQGAVPGELQVVVVANGCRDRTAEVARSISSDVRVIETDIPSKTNALNLGDAASSSFPRFYVDADVILSIEAIRDVAGVLNGGVYHVAAPRIALDFSDANWFVRAFYDIWMRTPYLKDGIGGAGVYAITEEGRRRFDKFPPVTADDSFVRLHFKPGERKLVRSSTSTVTPPRTLATLVKIKTRGYFGNIELKRLKPDLFAQEAQAHGPALMKLACNVLLWPKLAVYAYVRVAARRAGRKRLEQGDHATWERDESSRVKKSIANVS